MCGTVKATVTTVCAPLPPPQGSWKPTVPYITNIDHIKGASFADPLSTCPVDSTPETCTSDTAGDYGVIARAATAPLRDVVYDTPPVLEPTEPSFPDEFFQANTDCSVEGSTCNFIGADFSTNVMTEYATLPYVVDTGYSVPSNVGVFMKDNSPQVPTFTAPPGYKDHYGFDTTNDSQKIEPLQTAGTVVECSVLCNTTTNCYGFNYRLSSRECQLVKKTEVTQSWNGLPIPPRPFQKVTDPLFKAYIREESLNPTPQTSYPTGTNMTHEGNYCSDAPACNADLTKLVTDGKVTSFSTAELESCAYCPVRLYDKNKITNEVGTFSDGNYNEHLLFKTQPGESSPLLETGFYSVRTWLLDTYNIFGTQTIYYMRDVGMFTISNGKVYGTLNAPNSSSFKKETDIVYDISPVTYVDNGYIFRLLSGGNISRLVNPPKSTSSGGGSQYNQRSLVTYSCDVGLLFTSASDVTLRNADITKCVMGITSTEPKGTKEFNDSVFIVTPSDISLAGFFSQLLTGKKYISIGDSKWAILLGAPTLTTFVKTTTEMTVPVGGNIALGTGVTYGEIQLNVSANSLKAGDRVTLASSNTLGITFTVETSVNFRATLQFDGNKFPSLGGLVIPQGTVIQSTIFRKEFQFDMFNWYNDSEPDKWSEIVLSNDVLKTLLLQASIDDGPMGDPYESYGLFRTVPLPPAASAVSWSNGSKTGCNTGCNEYLLYGCYNSDNYSCDTYHNGAAMRDPACEGTFKVCVPDKNTLIAKFPPVITNLTPIDINRIDHPAGYSGLSHSYDPNMTDINRTRWSTTFIVDSYTDATGGVHSKTIPTDPQTLNYFPFWTQRRILDQHYLNITVSLQESASGCPPGYGVKNLNNFSFCQICPAGTYSPGGQFTSCKSCTSGNFCPQGSTNDTTRCVAGFYCETPASQFACPLGFYCPLGSTKPISCDTEILPDDTTTTTTITSSISPTTTPQTSVTFSVPNGFTFVKGAVVGLPGIVGPLQWTGGNNFNIVFPQFWSTIIQSGATLTVQTKAHYCPLQSTSPQRCERGKMCPTSMQQLYCPAGNYCNDGSNLGVFAGTQCPPGTYYSPPDMTSTTGLTIGQTNTDGSKCYTCPSDTTGPNGTQSGCVCKDTALSWSVYAAKCIKKCPAGQAPDPDSPLVCKDCPDGTYTHVEGLPACIRCADNFTSYSANGANGAAKTSGATGCTCTKTRGDGVTLQNGSVTWDQQYNRCKVTCSSGTAYWSDCVANTISATAKTFNQVGCQGDAASNQCCYSCRGLTASLPQGYVNCEKLNNCRSPYADYGGVAYAWTNGTGPVFSLNTQTLQCSYTYIKNSWYMLANGRQNSPPISITQTISATPSCPSCFTLSGTTCVFSGGSDSSCYVCPASSLTYSYNGVTNTIYQSSPSGSTCPIINSATLNSNPPSPWGNDGLFDGNTSGTSTTGGLGYLVSKLGTLSNFSPRDGSIKCAPGKVCSSGTISGGPSVTAKDDCPAGYYCTSSSLLPIECPIGSYCSSGSSVPTACSSGSYCPAKSSSDTTCPAGYFCSTPIIKTPCPGGKYSTTTGATTDSVCLPCPAGSYCPAGSAAATSCGTGKFCPIRSYQASDCAAGYYCPNTSTQILCPSGVSCPVGTTKNYGFVCGRTQMTTNYTSCTNCPNPNTDFIWDPRTVTSATAVTLPPLTDSNGAYNDITFQIATASGDSFVGGTSVVAISGTLKISGTVVNHTATQFVVHVTGYDGSGSSSGSWTITPYGCDTVKACSGHMTNATNFMSCQGCPLPQTGYVWKNPKGCETIQCENGKVPSADLSTCTTTPPNTCTQNSECARGQMCATTGKCTSCVPGTQCSTCPAATPTWDGVVCF